MTLSAASSLAEVQAAYDDNASYAEDRSPQKARAFVTACRILLRRLPRRASRGGRAGNEVELDPRILQEELLAAQRWLLRNDTSDSTAGRVSELSFERFRD
jgi:hypothetical protein